MHRDGPAEEFPERSPVDRLFPGHLLEVLLRKHNVARDLRVLTFEGSTLRVSLLSEVTREVEKLSKIKDSEAASLGTA